MSDKLPTAEEMVAAISVLTNDIVHRARNKGYTFENNVEYAKEIIAQQFQPLLTAAKERDDWKGAGMKIATKLYIAGAKSDGIVDGVSELIKERDGLLKDKEMLETRIAHLCSVLDGH